MNDHLLGNIEQLNNFHFQPLEVFLTEHQRVYQRRILDLEPLKDRFQYINALCTDGHQYLLIGTEGGEIIVFSLLSNRAIRLIKADKWLNSLLLSRQHVFTVGQARTIACYQLVSGRLTHAFAQAADGYGSKGVKLSDTAITNKIIANVGFGKFKIFDAVKLKVIYCFDIGHDTLNEIEAEHGTQQPTVLNYCVIKRLFKVCYLLEEDSHLYFYNYKEHKLLRKIKLFDLQENQVHDILLVNSLLMEQDGFLFIVLQFSKNQEDSNHELKTILFVVRIFNMEEHKKIEIIFHSRLCNLK